MNEDNGRLDYKTIRQLCGDIADWKIVAIERSGADIGDLEIALAWMTGESDIMGEERTPLSGLSALLYEILISDEEEWEEPADRPGNSR